MIVCVITFAIMPAVGAFSDRFDKFKMFALASVLMVISIVIYSRLDQTTFWILVIVNGLMMMGIMARMIPSQALTASLPESQDRGAFMSIN